MQYYTVVGDSYDDAVKKARSLYGDGIRIHSRRDYTTGGGLFTKRRQHCEIVCYLAHGGGSGRSGERDISEFAAEAKTPDPSTLTTSEMLDTEIHRTRTENPEAGMHFVAASGTVMAKSGETNLRTLPTTNEPSQVVGQLTGTDTAQRVAVDPDRGWTKLNYNGQMVYAVSSYLTVVE